MHAYIGTSGYSYDFWKGSFYPNDLKSDAMLGYYGERFDTVEINNTFYRMPKTEVVQRWADVVPEHFRFVIKASRRITHIARLKATDDSVEYLARQLEPLGSKLGAVLFQCPPKLRKDVARLQAFCARLSPTTRAVLEFRHPSWFCDEIYDCLRGSNVSMCIGDYGEDELEGLEDGRTPLVATTDFGYLRLRAETYTDDELKAWIDRFDPGWQHVFVFFKHEETAPTMVERLRALMA